MYPREVPPGPSPVGDGHVPQCDEQGRYRPLQCHGSSGHCWCVDAAGQEIAGTRTAPEDDSVFSPLPPCMSFSIYIRRIC
uniref:Thyroglobulin type-1 domain-containing protein n=1 Tax=Cyanistes caeruleus TaxID=156563 RepID=A0A8C0U1T5_CYACU